MALSFFSSSSSIFFFFFFLSPIFSSSNYIYTAATLLPTLQPQPRLAAANHLEWSLIYRTRFLSFSLSFRSLFLSFFPPFLFFCPFNISMDFVVVYGQLGSYIYICLCTYVYVYIYGKFVFMPVLLVRKSMA